MYNVLFDGKVVGRKLSFKDAIRVATAYAVKIHHIRASERVRIVEV